MSNESTNNTEAKKPKEVKKIEIQRTGNFDFDNSYFIYGEVSDAKNAFARKLAEKEGIPLISIDKLVSLPKLEDLQKMKASNDYSMFSAKELDTYIMVREKCGDKISFEDFGYTEENKKTAESEFGSLSGYVYSRQFESLVLESLTKKLDGKFVIQSPADLPIDLESEKDKFIEMAERKAAETGSNPFVVDETRLENAKTKELINEFTKRVYVQLPNDKTKWPTECANEENDLMISRRSDFKNVSGLNVNVSALYNGEQVSENSIDNAVSFSIKTKTMQFNSDRGESIKSYAGAWENEHSNIAQIHALDEEENEKKRGRAGGLFRKIGRGIGKFFKIVTGIALVELAVKAIKGQKLTYIPEDKTYETELNGVVEKVSADELDEAKTKLEEENYSGKENTSTNDKEKDKTKSSKEEENTSENEAQMG